MVERAQHRGHVAQGRARAGALRDRLRRLALQVDDDEPAVGGPQHLADVEVAVQALQRDRPGGRRERVQLGQDARPQAAQLCGRVGWDRRDRRVQLGAGRLPPSA